MGLVIQGRFHGRQEGSELSQRTTLEFFIVRNVEHGLGVHLLPGFSEGDSVATEASEGIEDASVAQGIVIELLALEGLEDLNGGELVCGRGRVRVSEYRSWRW